MTVPPAEGLARMSGTEIRDVLLRAVAAELEACALLADDLGDRLTRSGRPDQAMIAVQLAARIRARGSVGPRPEAANK